MDCLRHRTSRASLGAQPLMVIDVTLKPGSHSTVLVMRQTMRRYYAGVAVYSRDTETVQATINRRDWSGSCFAFADHIEQTPTHLRRVDCIFISAHSRHTASDPHALSTECVRKQDVYSALEQIPHAISPCVRIVHAFFVFLHPFVLLPVSLPILEELVVHGPLIFMPRQTIRSSWLRSNT
jgi:hypothetical protein